MFLVRTAKQGRAALGLLIGMTIPAGLPAPAEAHIGGRVFPIAELTDGMLERIQLDDGDSGRVVWPGRRADPDRPGFHRSMDGKPAGSVRFRPPHLAGLARRTGSPLPGPRGQR